MDLRLPYKRFSILLSIVLLCLSSCTRKIDEPEIAQMRLRNMQSHTYVKVDAKTVAKEVIALLQDEGYMLKNINPEMGVLTAERNFDIEKFSTKFFAKLFSGKRGRWKKYSTVELTANFIEEKGNTRMRINYLVRVFDNFGRMIDVHQVLDEKQYGDFFTKIQRELLNRGK